MEDELQNIIRKDGNLMLYFIDDDIEPTHEDILRSFIRNNGQINSDIQMIRNFNVIKLM